MHQSLKFLSRSIDAALPSRQLTGGFREPVRVAYLSRPIGYTYESIGVSDLTDQTRVTIQTTDLSQLSTQLYTYRYDQLSSTNDYEYEYKYPWLGYEYTSIRVLDRA